MDEDYIRRIEDNYIEEYKNNKNYIVLNKTQAWNSCNKKEKKYSIHLYNLSEEEYNKINKFIKDNNIQFNTTLNYMEDALFLITYLKYCKSISGVKRILYDVQINSKSLCRNQDLKSRREKDKILAIEAISNVSNN